MPYPSVAVRVEQLVDEVAALRGHVLVVLVGPLDAPVKDVLEDLLGGVSIEGRVPCGEGKRGGGGERG